MVGLALRRSLGGLRADRHDLLEGTHRQALGDDAGRQPVLDLGVVDADQGPGMAGRQDAGSDPSLDCRGQLEEPERVADLRT